MRTRVASIVTLLTLVLLGFLLIQSCSLLAKEENQNYRDNNYYEENYFFMLDFS